MAYEVPISANMSAFNREIEKARGQVAKLRADAANIGRGQGAGSYDNQFFTVPMGPNQLQQKAIRAEQLAAMTGDQALIRDARIARNKADRRAYKENLALDPTIPDEKKPKSREDLIWDAIQTSRVGRGGQLFPLVNRLRAAGLANPEEMQGHMATMGISPAMASSLAPMVTNLAKAALPAMVGAAAGLAVAYGAYQLAEGAAGSIARGSSAFWGAGGTAGETGQLMALGGDSAKALAFGDALRGGGIGSAFFRSKGIVDQGQYTVDKAGNYVRAIDELRNIKSDRYAIQVARSTGMSDQLWTRDLSDGTYNRLKGSNGDMGSAGERRDEAEYRATKDILGNSWDKIVRTIGKPFMRWGDEIINHPLGLFDPMEQARIITGWDPFGSGKKRGGSDSSEVVDAMKDMTRALKDHAELIGGGSRAKGAIPSGWKGAQMEEALKGQAAMLGSFGV